MISIPAFSGDFGWTDTIGERSCSAPGCGIPTRRRFCQRHREIFRVYGAPTKGPSRATLSAAERYCKRQLGPERL